MTIYPKISFQDMSNEMKEIIKKHEGVEIQFFHKGDILKEFEFENQIRKTKSEYPQLKEIVIHPPLNKYNIEFIMFKDNKILENQLRTLVELSKELNIKLSLIYHTYWTKDEFEMTELKARIQEKLRIIENTDVTLLIENIYMILDEHEECSALEICKSIDHPNLKMCLDTTHIHCKANIYRKDFNNVIRNAFKKEECQKYIKQIHFAAALKNDGYIEKNTHGRRHEDMKSLKEDVEWLEKLGLKNKIFVTEVSEDDYYKRTDQIEEIKMLENL